MRLAILASGSSGNALALVHDRAALFIDAGLSCREHMRRLAQAGVEDAEPLCIFLSHEHHDHARGAGIVARRWNIPLYAADGTAEASGSRLGKLPELRTYSNGETLEIGPFSVRTFRVPHDAADPSGYVIEWDCGRLGIATDLGSAGPLIRESLSGCTGVVLEFNHDEDMLWAGSYPWPLKQRIASTTGHLSNDAAADLLADIACPELKVAVLAHLSRENNLPELAANAASEAVSGIRLAAGMHDRALDCIDF